MSPLKSSKGFGEYIPGYLMDFGEKDICLGGFLLLALAFIYVYMRMILINCCSVKPYCMTSMISNIPVCSLLLSVDINIVCESCNC